LVSSSSSSKLPVGPTKFPFQYHLDDARENEVFKFPDSFQAKIRGGETNVIYRVLPHLWVGDSELPPVASTFYVVTAPRDGEPEQTTYKATPYLAGGPLELEATLHRTSYRGGEWATCRLMISNLTGYSVTVLNWSLYQNFLLDSGSKRENGLNRLKQEGISRPAIPRDFWGCQYFNFLIPEELAFSPSTISNNFTISYFIRLHATINMSALTSTGLDLDIPLHIYHYEMPGTPIKPQEHEVLPNIYWRPPWQEDNQSTNCNNPKCNSAFGTVFNRRHHCRHCGLLFCSSCVVTIPLLNLQYTDPVNVCLLCRDMAKDGGLLYKDWKKSEVK